MCVCVCVCEEGGLLQRMATVSGRSWYKINSCSSVSRQAAGGSVEAISEGGTPLSAGRGAGRSV